ncbi:hypothetical protein CEB3_c00050 [Peptococcaceae bacterium CEB3]|nr:hypothetical protein CEB3_c00050 [Peptococcaceae bacterium CEB3]
MLDYNILRSITDSGFGERAQARRPEKEIVWQRAKAQKGSALVKVDKWFTKLSVACCLVLRDHFRSEKQEVGSQEL